MPAQSPSNSAARLSPRQPAVNPNINPFAPLSPDLAPVLELDGSHNQFSSDRPFIFYPRATLLSIAKECRDHSWPAPPGLGGLDTWYGPPPGSKSPTQPVVDPAIASIGQSNAAGQSSRRGGPPPGFGEGFGFGGGIGEATRGLSRGGRQSGRRQVENAAGRADESRDPAKSFNRPERQNRAAEDKREGPERRNRRDEGEWRRNERSAFVPSHHREADSSNAEPAWMNDGPDETIDPAIVTPSASDPLIKFTPGEDMIAAHKRNMKARDPDVAWRGDKPLVSFFGSDKPSDLQTKQTVPPQQFNAERYLLPKKMEAESLEQSSSTQSRFQKFFSTPSAPATVPSIDDPKAAMEGPVRAGRGEPVDARTTSLLDALKGPPDAGRHALGRAAGSHPQAYGYQEMPFEDQPHIFNASSQRPSLHDFDHAPPHPLPPRNFPDRPFPGPSFPPPWSHNAPDHRTFSGEYDHRMGLPPPQGGYSNDGPISRNPPPHMFNAPYPTAHPREYASAFPMQPPIHEPIREQIPQQLQNQQFPYLLGQGPVQRSSPYPSQPGVSATDEANEKAQKLLATLFAGAGKPPQR